MTGENRVFAYTNPAEPVTEQSVTNGIQRNIVEAIADKQVSIIFFKFNLNDDITCNNCFTFFFLNFVNTKT